MTWGEGDQEGTMEANDRRLRGEIARSVSVKVTAPLHPTSNGHFTILMQMLVCRPPSCLATTAGQFQFHPDLRVRQLLLGTVSWPGQ